MRLDVILIAMQKVVVDFGTDKFRHNKKLYDNGDRYEGPIRSIFIALAKKTGTNEYEPQ